MKRYAIIPRRMADIDVGTDAEHYLAKTIIEQEPLVIDTGVLDRNGNTIYSIEETGPIGFVIHKGGHS
jgi:hypothetical protein